METTLSSRVQSPSVLAAPPRPWTKPLLWRRRHSPLRTREIQISRVRALGSLKEAALQPSDRGPFDGLFVVELLAPLLVGALQRPSVSVALPTPTTGDRQLTSFPGIQSKRI
ncbi:unnamed protein product [Acanthoscelides obtectus]|uniref:Uncharacterized protein n=1 Tax=Acanthoscelides obtectus TaxID=200917 RepID=A0A9P0KMK9_ACAOB|nr:unnamed protein product [Acanthoscelides obtectus]CAK1669265.1 hypothetical protein AOBTE_LOCUS26910 [Acanthoscelides obtectus]